MVYVMDKEFTRIISTDKFQCCNFDSVSNMFIYPKLNILFMGIIDELMAVEMDSLQILARFKCDGMPKSINIENNS